MSATPSRVRARLGKDAYCLSATSLFCDSHEDAFENPLSDHSIARPLDVSPSRLHFPRHTLTHRSQLPRLAQVRPGRTHLLQREKHRQHPDYPAGWNPNVNLV